VGPVARLGASLGGAEKHELLSWGEKEALVIRMGGPATYRLGLAADVGGSQYGKNAVIRP